MSRVSNTESGNMGRISYARIRPNEDLVKAVEKLCLVTKFKNAFVRGALGSLVDASLEHQDGQVTHIKGPAIEIVSIAGEVRTLSDGSVKADLTGVVADTEGNVSGGYFVAGGNPICMTLEITLEEWLPNDTKLPISTKE